MTKSESPVFKRGFLGGKLFMREMKKDLEIQRRREDRIYSRNRRLAYTDPYYNSFIETNEVAGTCLHGGIYWQVCDI